MVNASDRQQVATKVDVEQQPAGGEMLRVAMDAEEVATSWVAAT